MRNRHQPRSAATRVIGDDDSPETRAALERIRERLLPVLVDLGLAEGWEALLNGLVSALVGISVETKGTFETERALRRTIELLPDYVALKAVDAMPPAGTA